MLAVSIAKDFREYDKASTDLVMGQPSGATLVVKVNEPEINYNNNMFGIHANDAGWDIDENTLRYTNVKLRVRRSDDSAYHVTVHKFAAGESSGDARKRAERTAFNISTQDSILNIGSGLAIDRSNKFRLQGLIVEVQVPAGKKIRFDESLENAYSRSVVRMFDRDNNRGWSRRDRDWDEWNNDDYIDWRENVDYIMTTDGKLVQADKAVESDTGVFEKKTSADSLRHQIEQREKELEKNRQQIEKDREQLLEIERRRRENNESTTQTNIHRKVEEASFDPIVPLII
jgi:hypothetical protein